MATEVRGSRVVAEETMVIGRRARFAEVALVNGTVGVVVAPRGRLFLAITFTIDGERITGYEVIADPARLQRLELAVLDLRDARDARDVRDAPGGPLDHRVHRRL
ncbi:hypothetical protein [Streptomyces sp. NPDC051662]|uniref:hypothetical protein n=1 Tax=Streptomyces sp. NPDC051662 TaxID=3154750 RepID=UPI0034412CA4